MAGYTERVPAFNVRWLIGLAVVAAIVAVLFLIVSGGDGGGGGRPGY